MKKEKQYEVTYRKTYKDYLVDEDEVEICSYEKMKELIDDQADGGIIISRIKVLKSL